jgi:hypothetical protein
MIGDSFEHKTLFILKTGYFILFAAFWPQFYDSRLTRSASEGIIPSNLSDFLSLASASG